MFLSLEGDTMLAAGYASDAANGRSLALANTGSVSNQVCPAVVSIGDRYRQHSSWLGAAGYHRMFWISMRVTLSRQRHHLEKGNNPAMGTWRDYCSISGTLAFVFFSSSISCERATGLTGDIFVAQYRVKYPSNCGLATCKRRFLARVQDALRMNYRTVTVVMNFTTGEVRNVRLVFCGFFSLSRSRWIRRVSFVTKIFRLHHQLHHRNTQQHVFDGHEQHALSVQSVDFQSHVIGSTELFEQYWRCVFHCCSTNRDHLGTFHRWQALSLFDRIETMQCNNICCQSKLHVCVLHDLFERSDGYQRTLGH